MKLFWVVFTKAYFGVGWQASLLKNRREDEPEHLYKALELYSPSTGAHKDYSLHMLKADLVGTPKFRGN